MLLKNMNVEGIVIMENQKKADFCMHSLMCFIGGFLGAYAIINRGGNLGSAQTSNLIYLVLCFLGHNITEFLIRILGVFLYIAGIELYVYLTHKTKINIQRYGIAVDMVGFLLLSFIPATANPIVGLLPLFFIMSTQWSVFHGTNAYTSSTIFSTNNLRQMFLAFGEYLCNKDHAQIAKAKYFANSLLWYHLGVAISFFSCKAFGIHACLFCFIPAFLALIITYKDAKFVSVFLKRKAMA